MRGHSLKLPFPKHRIIGRKMPKVGDRVRVLKHSNSKVVGSIGKIVCVDTESTPEFAVHNPNWLYDKDIGRYALKFWLVDIEVI